MNLKNCDCKVAFAGGLVILSMELSYTQSQFI
jgi:hypothetical protein